MHTRSAARATATLEGALRHVITTNHKDIKTAATLAVCKAWVELEAPDPDAAYIMANVHPRADALRLTARVLALKRQVAQLTR